MPSRSRCVNSFPSKAQSTEWDGIPILFEDVGGSLIPRLAIDPDGTPRAADGKRWLDLAQMVEQAGGTSDVWRTLWHDTLDEVILGASAAINQQRLGKVPPPPPSSSPSLPVEADLKSPEYWDLLNQAALLIDMIDRTDPVGGPISHELERVRQPYGPDLCDRERLPDPAALLAGIERVLALGPSVRRRILRGWEYFRWPTRQAIAEMMTTELVPIVEISPHPTGDIACSAGHHFTFSGDLSPLLIQVRWGSTRDEVLRGLGDAIRMIIDHWPALITGPQDDAEAISHSKLAS